MPSLLLLKTEMPFPNEKTGQGGEVLCQVGRGHSQTLASVSRKGSGNRSERKKQHKEARLGFTYCPTLSRKRLCHPRWVTR